MINFFSKNCSLISIESMNYLDPTKTLSQHLIEDELIVPTYQK